jgi:hypothetical protein
MSALLRDLRVGKWIYADSLGKPGSGGLMGRIICLPWIKDQQVAVLEITDDYPSNPAKIRTPNLEKTVKVRKPFAGTLFPCPFIFSFSVFWLAGPFYAYVLDPEYFAQGLPLPVFAFYRAP